MKKINLNSVAFLVLGVFLLLTPALSQAIITSLVTAFFRDIDLLLWVNLAQNFWILNLIPKVVGATLVAGFAWKHLKTRFKVDLPKIKVQTTRLATYSLLFMLCAGLFLFADVPVSEAATTATTGYILDTPVSEHAWLIGAYSDGTYYAINGGTWDNMVAGVGSTAWATYKTNSTTLTAQVLAVCTSGTIYMKDVAFDMNLFDDIPEDVRVICSYNAEYWEYIDSADSSGSPYTVSVGSGVNVGYYLAADSEGRICFTSSNQTALQDTVLGATTSGEIRLNEVAFDLALMNNIGANVQVVCSVGKLTETYINSAAKQGALFEVATGSGQTQGYYIARDSANRIWFASTNSSTALQTAHNGLTVGGTLKVSGTGFSYDTTLTVKGGVKIVGDSVGGYGGLAGTVLTYTGNSVAMTGTNIDHFAMEDITIKLGADALGGLLVGTNSVYTYLSHVTFIGGGSIATATQYGVRYDAANTACYYNWLDYCFFRDLQYGIVTNSSGTGKANGQLITQPQFHHIYKVGIDFSQDNSSAHSVIGGVWTNSLGAIGFKSNGRWSQFIGGTLEMGDGANSYELGVLAAYNVISISDNHAKASVDYGLYNDVTRMGTIPHTLYSDFNNLSTEWTETLTGTSTSEIIYLESNYCCTTERLSTGENISSTAKVETTQYLGIVTYQGMDFSCNARISSLTNETVKIGLFYNDARYIAFIYDPSVSPNWFATVNRNGDIDSVDTGVAATTDFTSFKILALTNKLYKFVVGGVVTEINAENAFGTYHLKPSFRIVNNGAENKNLYINWVRVTWMPYIPGAT